MSRRRRSEPLASARLDARGPMKPAVTAPATVPRQRLIRSGHVPGGPECDRTPTCPGRCSGLERQNGARSLPGPPESLNKSATVSAFGEDSPPSWMHCPCWTRHVAFKCGIQKPFARVTAPEMESGTDRILRPTSGSTDSDTKKWPCPGLSRSDPGQRRSIPTPGKRPRGLIQLFGGLSLRLNSVTFRAGRTTLSESSKL